MVNEEKQYAGDKQEENKLREGIRDSHESRRIRHRCDHKEAEGAGDGVAGIKTAPYRIDAVGAEKAQKNRGVRNRHGSSDKREASLRAWWREARDPVERGAEPGCAILRRKRGNIYILSGVSEMRGTPATPFR